MDYKQKLNELPVFDIRNKVDFSIKVFLAAVFIIFSGFIFVGIADAQETPFSVLSRGIVEGVGNHFQVVDSNYLNILLDSDQVIQARVESIPETVSIAITPTDSQINSSWLTIGGLNPLATYYKYEDDYHNLVQFTTDESGQYSYSQDISNPHFVFIQSRASTKFIKDDFSGGDCVSMGAWDVASKTCTLTSDVFESIQIDDSGITLNGAGHSVSGWGYGISATNKSNVTIKNVTVVGFTAGIRLHNSSNNLISGNTLLGNYDGIQIYSSNNNTVIDNSARLNAWGIISYSSHSDIIKNNISEGNSSVGAGFVFSSSYVIFQNILSANDLGILMGSVSNSVLSENLINFSSNWGIRVTDSYNVKVYNNNFINNPTQVFEYPGVGILFSQPLPVGGNYWSDFDTLTEGCLDAGGDNICDSPYMFTGGQDDFPWKVRDGWENQPPTFSDLNQYKSDGLTPISENGITTEDSVVFKAVLNDPDSDQIKLQIELKEFSQPFDSQDLLESDFVSSGSEVTIARYGLINGQYKWRARVIDSQGNVSQWQEFGTEGNMDFEVQLPLNVKAANLAKELANHPEGYLWGGKGWDYNLAEFVSSANILSGYTYYNPNLPGLNVGVGVDCSGLIAWAFNRAFDAFTPAVNNFVKYVNANGLYGDFQSDAISEAELLPGSAMFFDWGKFNESTQTWDGIKDSYIDHVAMYVGESGGYNVVNARSPDFGIEIAAKEILQQLAGFENFRRIHQADVEIEIAAGSPVDLIVTDPDGFVITPNSVILSDEEYIREVPGILYYLEMERGSDGSPIDHVYSPVMKNGNYIIGVSPSAGSLPTDTYDLEFRAGGQTIILADDVPISEIPSEKYGVAVEEGGIINPFIPVSVDIKPGSFPNSINLGSGGAVPVAVFGTATFDVSQIDPATITLANASIKLKGSSQPIISYQDVNEDSINDIAIHVVTEALELTETDVQAELNGFLLDGRNIKGFDSVRIVP
ncbi:MAG: Cell surface protein [Candidatus Wolfebacteria bacterium GW2011_GWC1_43_10]|uniref:Cell surface protein n=2 Tax=Candidatus Wolfeibacteriota TaxID=1752735 RepID=A0A0G1CAK0_9BACT|nr:MAG: Cell surface protein [Candidatus Wolfebacteria bacterium GW2011_GWC1_43_10]KKT22518.1 MAG: Cell surface protein [Parcubacteria group bacterium GW2011_GWB1_43_8b]